MLFKLRLIVQLLKSWSVARPSIGRENLEQALSAVLEASVLHRTSLLPPDVLELRSRLILTYAMCGFANFGSLGILVGGALMPVFILMFVRGVRSFERLGSIPGALTRLLARAAGDLILIEYDPALAAALTAEFAATPNTQVRHADILTLDITAVARERVRPLAMFVIIS